MKKFTVPIKKLKLKAGDLVRQGDVLFRKILLKELINAESKKEFIVALGEHTGHKHKETPEDGGELAVLEEKDSRFMQLSKTANLVHETHAPVRHDSGVYEELPQYDYTPEEIRRTAD